MIGGRLRSLQKIYAYAYAMQKRTVLLLKESVDMASFPDPEKRKSRWHSRKGKGRSSGTFVRGGALCALVKEATQKAAVRDKEERGKASNDLTKGGKTRDARPPGLYA